MSQVCYGQNAYIFNKLAVDFLVTRAGDLTVSLT